MNVAGIVLFSGPGGSSLGLRQGGLVKTIGVEHEANAVNTARAAGLDTLEADVRPLVPNDVRDLLEIDGPYDLLLQSSPPCQGLSKAGKGAGREDLGELFVALKALACQTRLRASLFIPHLIEHLWSACKDERSPLTFETIRWVAELDPEYVMLEQVPAALPIWQAFAEVLQAWGYNTWVDLVQAEQYGVPQTRKRAILMASRVGKVVPPTPTHSKFHNRSPERLDPDVEKWVSMAEALGWGMTARPYPTIAAGVGQGGPDSLAVGGSGARRLIYSEHESGRWVFCPTNLRPNATLRRPDQPAPTLAFGHETPRWIDREALIAEVEPRVNNQSGTEFDLSWPVDRPAPVIAGREIVTMPGANANRYNGATKSRNDGIRVSATEAGVLQSFPADYPWQGNKTRQFQQIGNAVPPRLQAALTRGLIAERQCLSDVA